MTQQIPRILMAEQIFAGRHRPWVKFRQRRLQLVIQRIASFLIPEQIELPQHLRIGNRGLQIEPPIRIHRQPEVSVNHHQGVRNPSEHRLHA